MKNEKEGKRPSGEEIRQELFELNKERLEQLAFRATRKGLKLDQFLVVCIDVYDSTWTELVNLLMPNADWQQIRDRGEKPIARGTVRAELADYLCEIVPGIASALRNPAEGGQAKTVIMGAKGASVYLITPTPQYKNN